MELAIFALVLGLVTLLAITLQKAIRYIPLTELKRRARSDDQFAGVLYKTAAYGASAKILLWGITGLSAAGFFVIVSRNSPVWMALVTSLALVWVGFAWLPNTRLGFMGKTVTRYCALPLSWFLGRGYPVLSRIANWFVSCTHIKNHTDLYQKEDLLNLLEAQKAQPDNRISSEELRIAAGGLSFGNKLVRNVMTPRRMVKAIAATDSIGPHLMDELHASGHSRFPVYQDKPDNFIGMLYAHDLMAEHASGQVRDLMKREVYYVHEEQTLHEVLNAFLKTKHHLFVVVNTFEEITGIITIEDVLEQILGKPIIDEFDKYNDLRAVAAVQAKEDQKNKHDNTDNPTS